MSKLSLPRSEAEPAQARGAPLSRRIGELARLPLFFDLKARRAVVVGGSAAAAWKVELLLAAGARVELYATEADLSDDMRALVADGTWRGRIQHHDRAWSKEVFRGAALAVADIEDEEEAEAFSRAAREAGVPVNLIDKPVFCDFTFGAIVNRSPVVVGISTDGAVPVLAQAIRRRIEATLPLSLAQSVLWAKRLRGRVASCFPRPTQRRKFWDSFAALAFAQPSAAVGESDWQQLFTEARGLQVKGRVTLVGAGPGDPEFLTLKALRALQNADVVLYDNLVSDEILEFARREAKRMLVGKSGHGPACRQEDINALMIALAARGRNIVRLKGGDPMIFGRAGEEIEACRTAGIAVEVVPGITAACAMAAALGVSLTHRDVARSLRFVTGHSKEGILPEDLDVAGLSRGSVSLVVYMPRHTAGALRERLGRAGLPDSTPVVAMANISTPQQSSWSGRLRQLPEGLKTLESRAPVLLGIGQVFGARFNRASDLGSAADATNGSTAAVLA